MRTFTVVTLLGLLLAAVLGNCGCVSRAPEPPRSAPSLAIGRTPAEQERAAVEVRTVCVKPDGISIGGGSGVQVTDSAVLTASHVVDCPGEASILVKVGDVWMPAITRAVDYEADVAALHLLVDVPGTRAALGHRPLAGQAVCMAVTVPHRARRCGTVLQTEPLPGDVRHDVLTEPGNSGSGVYDAEGHLVGIVTHYRRSAPGGLFSSLEDRPWMAR